MKPIYTDLHIHTSENPDQLNPHYDLDQLIQKVAETSDGSDFLISLTDHNTVNKDVYLKAVQRGVNIIVGVELHIKNYPEAPAYHCHIYFNLDKITEDVLDDINVKLDTLYPSKVVEKRDPAIPSIHDIINTFDTHDFMLLPHGGQSHATFDTSIPSEVKFDTTLEKSIYYNQFDGFTARGDAKLEKTQEYFKKLGINEFVHLITCSDNYDPAKYPFGKDSHPFKPTWMLARPTFNGLRLSLSEQSRLIYAHEKPKIWSENIRTVKHKRENIEIDVEFTSGLNVVIGSSSSGKSLLVDSIVRKIANHEVNSAYQDFEIDKIEIDNPSGMCPHYLSQNYIVGIVNNATEGRIEQIDIIQQVFPGDEEIKERINKELRTFKENIQDLIKNVKVLEDETKTLNKIPVLSRLIVKDKIRNNIFEGLMATDAEMEVLGFSSTKYESFIQNLDEIDSFLESYPFVTHRQNLIADLKKELEMALESYKKERQIRNIVTKEKEDYDELLRAANSEDQSKKQNFDRLVTSLKKYEGAYRNFFAILDTIANYSVNFDSEKIESMGHKLYIENDFVLNKEEFLNTVNSFLKNPVASYEKINPEDLFQMNFKKRPKVNDYDDFEKKIYSRFESLNRKKYKIITVDNREFDKLSPGWKTSVILDIILGYDKDSSPIIIDQPEDNLATNYINKGLVSAIKKIKGKKQIILVSHNATIPMLADAQNVILCRNEDNKLIIKSSPLEGAIDGKTMVDYIAEITDGGKPSIKKRVKKYNLKKFTE